MLVSEGYFKSAIELDAKYASAYAGLGQSYLLQAHYGVLTSREGYPMRKRLQ